MSRLTRLPRLVEASAGKPHRPGSVAHQRSVTALASGRRRWSQDEAHEVAQRFDELAEIWDEERGAYRQVPLRDALARGGPWPPGACLEIGAGTGLLTPLLESCWQPVLSVDLSPRMLSRSRHSICALADAARLPLRQASVEAVVLADAPLLASEVVRVLEPGGVVVWSNALGEDAPYHVPDHEIAAALGAADGSTWEAVGADAGWGTWLVLRRST